MRTIYITEEQLKRITISESDTSVIDKIKDFYDRGQDSDIVKKMLSKSSDKSSDKSDREIKRDNTYANTGTSKDVSSDTKNTDIKKGGDVSTGAGGDKPYNGNVSDKMKQILSDTDHIDSQTLGNGYAITSKSRHCCTSGPTTWYKRAGIPLRFWTSIVDGKKDAIFTHNPGWVKVAEGNGKEIDSFKDLRPGDVSVQFPTTKTKHACMWCGPGKGWRSDFKQNHCWVYSVGGLAQIWRYMPIQ